MPRRTDISSILVIGSGPIVIGQACEFDYSGTQACRVLRAEGFRVILVNSNPATIMTDPEFADATYVEPITPEFVEQVIALERPDALLATLGGQTALNAAIALHESGVLAKYGVELIGASVEAIQRGENREQFKAIVEGLDPPTDPTDPGFGVARSLVCHSIDDVLGAAGELGYPLVVRPSFTMGGVGSGFAHDEADLRRIAGAGLAASPTTEVLIEESILGWKEYELEVMRDRADNVVIVCSIENFDPMGVHTGDSITVAPAMTLTDREYQRMRDLAIGIIREVGVDTGGCNIQFAVDPATGRMIVIEMNPRVSRSSALASKATGFPIAKIAAKVAIGYTLDEIPNDITGGHPGQLRADAGLRRGEGAAVRVREVPGRRHHADHAHEERRRGDGHRPQLHRGARQGAALAGGPEGAVRVRGREPAPERRRRSCWPIAARPHDGRLGVVMQAIRAGATPEQVNEATHIDPWFVDQLYLVSEVADEVRDAPELTADVLRLAKRHGLSDAQVASAAEPLRGRRPRRPLGARGPAGLQDRRHLRGGVRGPDAVPLQLLRPRDRGRAADPAGRADPGLGPEPDRPGDRVRLLLRARRAGAVGAPDNDGAGYETVMVNCNPETVSTDYDTADRLYFEPLTCEDVLEVVHAEQQAGPVAGVIVQLGGQTPLRLAQALKDAGRADRRHQPGGDPPRRGARRVRRRARRGRAARRPSTGWPAASPRPARSRPRSATRCWSGPSYVLGGRGMEIVYDEATLASYIDRATEVSPAHPVLVDRFLDDAVEIDVDALYDGTELYLGGVMEHIEEAGVHSGDSACALPPITLGSRGRRPDPHLDRGHRRRRRASAG